MGPGRGRSGLPFIGHRQADMAEADDEDALPGVFLVVRVPRTRIRCGWRDTTEASAGRLSTEGARATPSDDCCGSRRPSLPPDRGPSKGRPRTGSPASPVRRQERERREYCKGHRRLHVDVWVDTFELVSRLFSNKSSGAQGDAVSHSRVMIRRRTRGVVNPVSTRSRI